MGLYECMDLLHFNSFYLNVHLYFLPAQAYFQFDVMKPHRQAATQSHHHFRCFDHFRALGQLALGAKIVPWSYLSLV